MVVILVEKARLVAEALLCEALPRRWFHTIGVAETASRLARVLDPDFAAHIEAAAWLHDIGYAPDLIDTGFHPIDGAGYLSQAGVMGLPVPPAVVGLVAHHTGAVCEAQQRGLSEVLEQYPAPDAVQLAILSCADLCTGPDGTPVDPAERIAEVLTRYPAEHPVHRAIGKSAPVLVAQARLVLGAAEMMRYGPGVAGPTTAEPV